MEIQRPWNSQGTLKKSKVGESTMSGSTLIIKLEDSRDGGIKDERRDQQDRVGSLETDPCVYGPVLENAQRQFNR